MKFFQLLVLFLIATIVQAQTEPRLVLPIGHTGKINSAVFNPNGTLVLTASSDKSARIFEVSTGKELHVFSEHKKSVLSAVFSPDGKLALTASEDNTARIYEVLTGKELHLLIGHSAVFSPDGKLVLTASEDNTVRIYEVTTGKKLQLLSGHSAVFSPDGKLVLTSCEDFKARIWKVSNGKKLQVLEGHTDWIETAVFSPNGKIAITASLDSTVRIYDVSSGIELQDCIRHKGMVLSALFSPDGKLALTKSIGQIIYDLSTGKEVDLFRGKTSVFSPKGKVALTESEDHSTRICEVSTGKKLQLLSVNTGFTSAIFSNDGELVLTVNNETIRIYKVSTGKELQVLSGHTELARTAVFSPDGKIALTTNFRTNVHFFEVSTGKELQRIGLTKSIASAVFSPNGKLVLTTNLDSIACIYEVSTGNEVRVFKGHTDLINSAVFSSDGTFALTSSDDSTSRIYEVSTGNKVQVFTRHADKVNSAVFSLDGTLALTSSDDSTSRIYEVSSGKEVQVFNNRHSDRVKSAVFSPDCRLALTVSYDTARIYDVSTGKELQILSGHTNYFNSVEFSPDGKYVLTSIEDTLSIYEVSTGKKLQMFSGHTYRINSAVFIPDGKIILSTGSDHKTILWDVAKGKPLYTRLQLKGDDWLVYDEHYRFDGTPGAIEKLYFVCGLEPIDLAQMKDSLWVPGLAERIMAGKDILINDKLAPKLSELNICNLTPVIEPIEQEDKRILKYRITPRNGGLGNTDVYINGNLTYIITPKQLEKKIEKKKEVYYLTLSTDTLQDYLIGEKNATNPILVKCKVKGTGIYGRGVVMEVKKTREEEMPHFFGVFIGVDDYGNPQKTPSDMLYRNLDFAAKDALDLSKAVEKTAANLFDTSHCHFYRLTGMGKDAPTKENIQRVLAEIGAQSKASDVLYIFFAGHGDIKKGKNEDGQEQDQIRFMLMNTDKRKPFPTSFGVEELTQWCSPKKIKAQKRVFVFDACHSGKIIGETMNFNGRGDEEGARIRQLDKLKDKNGMMILAAAADDESAYEDETLNQGVLTYHLLQVMKEQSDTSLIVRNWFDETIDLVKDYSKANGNKQEPSSFGDGRFEIGNVNAQVREVISIKCPKQRVGACEISAGSDEAETLFPNVEDKVHRYFSLSQSRGNLVYSEKSDKAYRALGSFNADGNKISVRYKIKLGNEQIGQTITLPQRKYKNEDELVQAIVTSITQEIEALSKHDEHCNLRKN